MTKYDEAFERGAIAAENGENFGQCPFPKQSGEAIMWRAGFRKVMSWDNPFSEDQLEVKLLELLRQP